MTDSGKMPRRSALFRRAAMAASLTIGLLGLGACDSTQGLLSSITGDDASAQPAANAGTQSAAAAAPASIEPIAPTVPESPDTGSPVGKRVRVIRVDMLRLADNINQHNAALLRLRAALSGDGRSYVALVDELRAHPGSGEPADQAQRAARVKQAQAVLDRMNGETAELGALSAQVASDAAFAAYVRQEINAATYLSGAVAEDRRALESLRALADNDMILVQRVAQAVSSDYARQTNTLNEARSRLAALDATEPGGGTARARTVAAAAAAAPIAEESRPLVTIRFDRRHVAFEHALYSALSRALARRPDARFELVAVSPSSGDAAQVSRYAGEAKRNAQNVLHALSRMGLPAERLTLSAMTNEHVRTSEVRIFVR